MWIHVLVYIFHILSSTPENWIKWSVHEKDVLLPMICYFHGDTMKLSSGWCEAVAQKTDYAFFFVSTPVLIAVPLEGDNSLGCD